MKLNLMIDLETLGTSVKAPVISIGATIFDNEKILETFYVTLDIHQQMNSKLRFADSHTIQWWMNQTDAAKKVFKEKPVDVKQGLDMFLNFINPYTIEGVKPWGNGSTFDISIIESLMKDYNIEYIPWGFGDIRDLRTFKEYVYDGKDTPSVGVSHNTLDDAIYQTNVVLEGIRRQRGAL